jgi:DNA-binding NarL/FixJ family response regulator
MASEIDRSSVESVHELLSDREFQVLQGIARGMKVKEIAEALSISQSTVRTYHERILRKMNMRNDAELTYYAVEKSLVE